MTHGPTKFQASCTKTLSAVEADPNRSNQHEFNGIAELKRIFGLTDFSKIAFFSVSGHATTAQSEVTWYEAREAHPTRSEYRLYFKTNSVMAQAKEGDSVTFGLDEIGNLHIVLLKKGTSRN
ncbi:hypothetical protein SAMN03159363_2023 [Variovorax sp. EL159]|nr:hypothetical protein SAMN03159363_2023 [Variovorax sp. EL159]